MFVPFRDAIYFSKLTQGFTLGYYLCHLRRPFSISIGDADAIFFAIGKAWVYTSADPTILNLRSKGANIMAGKFELKVSKNGKYFFNLLAGNGQIILSGEMYESKTAAESGIESVQKNSGDDARYERLTSANGDPYFTLKASNGQVIGKSEMYSSASSMENGIESVKANAAGAPIVEAQAG